MSESLESFIKLLLRSGLITESQLQEVRQGLSGESNDASESALAEQLADSGHLSGFQAKQVRQGKIDRLVVGDYIILHPVARGGMGEVFKARHSVMKREVAVKFTLPDADGNVTESSVERFQREVEAASQLMHPNIVSSLDAGRRGELCYLVMEYVRGSSLAQHIRDNGPMSFAQALQCTIQAAQGLEFAHSKGVIHRDVKPSNLLLTTGGQVKMLDMGLVRMNVFEHDSAQTLKVEDPLTKSGHLLGTVDYMAPEQAIDPHTADARSDIYALGCTFFYLLTGTPPYRRVGGTSTMSRIIAHREHPIPSLCASRADVPESFDRVFRKMLDKQPQKRHQSVSELILDLRKAQSDLDSGSDSLDDTVTLIQDRRTTGVKFGMIFAIVVAVAIAIIAVKTWSPSIDMAPVVPQTQQPIVHSIDLLDPIDLASLWKTGDGWEVTNGTLIIPDAIPSKLLFPVALPDVFQIETTVVRRSEHGPFAIGVSTASRNFHLLIDASRQGGNVRMTALGTTKDRLAVIVENEVALELQQPVDLVMRVGKDFVSLSAGEEIVLQWQGDFNDLVLPAGWQVGSDEGVFVGSNDNASFELTHLKVIPALATEGSANLRKRGTHAAIASPQRAH